MLEPDRHQASKSCFASADTGVRKQPLSQADFFSCDPAFVDKIKRSPTGMALENLLMRQLFSSL